MSLLAIWAHCSNVAEAEDTIEQLEVLAGHDWHEIAFENFVNGILAEPESREYDPLHHLTLPNLDLREAMDGPRLLQHSEEGYLGHQGAGSCRWVQAVGNPRTLPS